MDLPNPTPTKYKKFNRSLKNIWKILLKFFVKWTYLVSYFKSGLKRKRIYGTQCLWDPNNVIVSILNQGANTC